jgi:hypothetical protein
MRKELKLGSEGGDTGSEKCKRGYGGAYGEIWRGLRLECLESGPGGRFCVAAF